MTPGWMRRLSFEVLGVGAANNLTRAAEICDHAVNLESSEFFAGCRPYIGLRRRLEGYRNQQIQRSDPIRVPDGHL